MAGRLALMAALLVPGTGGYGDTQGKEKIWLVFDLNGTLVSPTKVRRQMGKLRVRPGVDALNRLQLSGLFRLALWSSAGSSTILSILPDLEASSGVTFERILHREHTLPAEDREVKGNEWDTLKPLRAYFGSLTRVLMIDDDFKAVEGEESNLIQIPSWDGRDTSDNVLNRLVEALISTYSRTGLSNDARRMSRAITLKLSSKPTNIYVPRHRPNPSTPVSTNPHNTANSPRWRSRVRGRVGEERNAQGSVGVRGEVKSQDRGGRKID
ncbi:hypothetical protein AAMO2058_001171200 [Amorphochlora amoebiformis]